MSIVLIIADRPNERQVAIERGLELAGKMGWGAQVAGFAYANLDGLKLSGNGERQAIKKQLLAKRREEVQAQVDRHKGEVHTAVSVVWEKSIHEWVDKQCLRKDYTAVVKTGRRTESFLYTSTDWHLLRECPAPVMIVAEKKWRATKPIMAAVDLSSTSPVDRELNDDVIRTAKAYAKALDTRLHVIHALHIPAVLTELDLVDEYTHIKRMKEELRPKLLKLARAHDIPLRAFKLKQGPVDKVITSEAARLKAQLVVMGTVGRSGVKGRLLGNTAEEVLDMLRTDVLAIKP
jgi:universal stress protein E